MEKLRGRAFAFGDGVSTDHIAPGRLLLIHGYNNDAEAAREAYEGFHARQGELGADARYGLGRSFVELYWPGDGDWGIASFLCT